ncbi:YeeE/YedE family protein [Photobacterium rosenbergii]|uniref:YeeE/YedE family protein n=1 Tax=Photobacterium rosenbergii TaxID=294936 RepID=UPI001C9948E3|nr:YeeE/YedE family protein [Photobacterium rosenbergii]MBY5944047.1 YeeE/YedE family protein [Photobacterium rosenbergii]
MAFEIPWDALTGGILLGISASGLLLLNGRIAGISGIVSGLLTPKQGEVSWRLLFVIGMLASGLLAPAVGFTLPETLPVSSFFWVGLAGLLVGIGTKVGNGCTSGHGICGMGRLSKRSIVATCIFMAVAIATVFVRLHVL